MLCDVTQMELQEGHAAGDAPLAGGNASASETGSPIEPLNHRTFTSTLARTAIDREQKIELDTRPSDPEGRVVHRRANEAIDSSHLNWVRRSARQANRRRNDAISSFGTRQTIDLTVPTAEVVAISQTSSQLDTDEAIDSSVTTMETSAISSAPDQTDKDEAIDSSIVAAATSASSPVPSDSSTDATIEPSVVASSSGRDDVLESAQEYDERSVRMRESNRFFGQPFVANLFALSPNFLQAAELAGIMDEPVRHSGSGTSREVLSSMLPDPPGRRIQSCADASRPFSLKRKPDVVMKYIRRFPGDVKKFKCDFKRCEDRAAMTWDEYWRHMNEQGHRHPADEYSRRDQHKASENTEMFYRMLALRKEEYLDYCHMRHVQARNQDRLYILPNVMELEAPETMRRKYNEGVLSKSDLYSYFLKVIDAKRRRGRTGERKNLEKLKDIRPPFVDEDYKYGYEEPMRDGYILNNMPAIPPMVMGCTEILEPKTVNCLRTMASVVRRRARIGYGGRMEVEMTGDEIDSMCHERPAFKRVREWIAMSSYYSSKAIANDYTNLKSMKFIWTLRMSSDSPYHASDVSDSVTMMYPLTLGIRPQAFLALKNGGGNGNPHEYRSSVDDQDKLSNIGRSYHDDWSDSDIPRYRLESADARMFFFPSEFVRRDIIQHRMDWKRKGCGWKS